MKKLFLILIFLFSLTKSYSNIPARFSFTETTGTYTQVSGGTVLGDLNNDDEIFMGSGGSASTQTDVGLPIGFTFSYDGVNYNRFGASMNGYIKLGNSNFTMICGGYYVDLNAIGDNTLISALEDDLQGQTGSVLSYKTTGSSPNRVLTIDWYGVREYNGSGDNFNFQIKLYETTNIIEFIYDSFVYGASGHQSHEGFARVGLYGSAGSGDYLTRETAWNSGTNGSSNGSVIALNSGSLPTTGTLYRFTPNLTLPIELLSFDGKLKNNKVELTWSTASEINNDLFVLERSSDAIKFTAIGKVGGGGNSTVKLDYSFIDQEPLNGVSYYRLRQVDYDGSYTFSNIIVIDNSSENSLIVKIYDISGQEVNPVELKQNIVYIYQYSDGSFKKMLLFK